jgi:hypothetical protein
MIVHLAKLLNQGDINERAYELAVKQLVLNTPPTGESKGSPLALNSGGKYSSNRKVSVPPLPSREGDVKGGEWKGMTSCLEHNTPSTATKSIDGKGKEPMYPLPTSTIEDNKSYNEDDKELYFDDELDELITGVPTKASTVRLTTTNISTLGNMKHHVLKSQGGQRFGKVKGSLSNRGKRQLSI